MYKVITNIYW